MVNYYRYLRFYSDGTALMSTTADLPAQVVSKRLKKKDPTCWQGGYVLNSNTVTCVFKRKRNTERQRIVNSRRNQRNRLEDVNNNSSQLSEQIFQLVGKIWFFIHLKMLFQLNQILFYVGFGDTDGEGKIVLRSVLDPLHNPEYLPRTPRIDDNDVRCPTAVQVPAFVVQPCQILQHPEWQTPVKKCRLISFFVLTYKNPIPVCDNIFDNHRQSSLFISYSNRVNSG